MTGPRRLQVWAWSLAAMVCGVLLQSSCLPCASVTLHQSMYHCTYVKNARHSTCINIQICRALSSQHQLCQCGSKTYNPTNWLAAAKHTTVPIDWRQQKTQLRQLIAGLYEHGSAQTCMYPCPYRYVREALTSFIRPLPYNALKDLKMPLRTL